MNLNEVQQWLGDLDDLREFAKPRRILQLEMLSADLAQYVGDFANLNNRYRTAWEESVRRRLEGIERIPTDLQRTFFALRHRWAGAARRCGLRLLFGQMRVGPDFQGALNVNQQQLVGFPEKDVIARPIVNVGGLIQDGDILPDQIPIQIFWAPNDQRWIAANNRGYTAYCFAQVQPLRLIARLPQQLELNRLGEVEGEGNIQDFNYQVGVTHLRVHPRTLPSDQMPVTTGPNTWTVTRVVSVPQTFN